MDILDKTDIAILRILQENSHLTTKEVASRVNLSTTPVFERIRRLEESGYIKKYIALLDADKLNRGFNVYCCVKLQRLSHHIATNFTSVIKDIPEVIECYNISGEYDFLLKVCAPDMKYYREFILNVLGTIEGLGSLTSMFVMAEVKHELAIPL
ncbi:MAG: Lrp/AsnC family transcriptional regulator [Muribaculaceae bacterium]|nr:Lrp/AsnC family transcriptional regulator [Muribaculaceae bacterium]